MAASHCVRFRNAPTTPAVQPIPYVQDVRGITCVITLFDCIQDGVLPAEMATAIRATVETAGGACVPLTAAARSMLLDAAAGPGWCTIVPVHHSPPSSGLLADSGRVSPLLSAKPVLIDAASLLDSMHVPLTSSAWQPLPLGWASSPTPVPGGGAWAVATILCARGEGSELVDLRVDAVLTRARTNSLPPPLLTSSTALGSGPVSVSTPLSKSNGSGYTPSFSTVSTPRVAAPFAGTPRMSTATQLPMLSTVSMQSFSSAMYSSDVMVSTGGLVVPMPVRTTTSLLMTATPSPIRAPALHTAPALELPMVAATDLVTALQSALGELHGTDGATAAGYVDMAFTASQVTPILRTMSELTFEEKHALAQAEAMRAAFAARGAIPLLVTCIRAMGTRTSESRQALEFAVQALTNIAFNRQAQATIAQDAIAVPVLLERMRVDGSDAEVALKVARCLATLCYDNPVAQARIISVGAIAECARALQMHAGIGFAVEKLVQLLTAVSEHPAAPRAFAEAHIIHVLATVARAPSCSARIRGMLAKLRASTACMSSAASMQAAAAVSAVGSAADEKQCTATNVDHCWMRMTCAMRRLPQRWASLQFGIPHDDAARGIQLRHGEHLRTQSMASRRRC